jgi:UDP-galactopyranose mutase
MGKILIVGAGFAGAVYARELAEAGFEVDVIDKRDHIGGNCYDYTHACGVRVHRYGPHLFHTSNMRVVDWVSRFTDWLPYEHRVVAQLPDNRFAPMPVNLNTVNAVFNTDLKCSEEVTTFLASRAIVRDPVISAEDHLFATIGPELTNLFFRPYTQKMWAMDLSETDAAVVRRLQIRTDHETRYFPNDTFQAMPIDGYTALFRNIFSHDRIAVRLHENFRRGMEFTYDACFNSMPIDEYFDFEYGELPYRSLRFYLCQQVRTRAPSYATINYTHSGPQTRETWWHNIAGHDQTKGPIVLKTIEEPCDYKENNLERFYPVKTSDGRYDRVYKRYAAKKVDGFDMNFIGRCGTYQYLDMHQVINQSLFTVHKWLEGHRA